MKCEDCKYWKRNPKHFHPEFGECLKIENYDDVKYSMDSDFKKNKMYVVPADGNDSFDMVGPDFGCIHFEEKEK